MSYLFADSTAAISFADVPELDITTNYTISYWVKLNSATLSVVPLRKGSNYGAYFEYGFGGRVTNLFTKTGTTGAYRAYSDTTAHMGTFVGGWHHIVMRGSAGTPNSVWIDGVDRTEGSNIYWFADTQDLTQPLYLGNQAALNAAIDGYLAEVAIWNSEYITDGAVTQLMGLESPMLLSSPPDWYVRLKDNAIEHISSAVGTVSLATQNADHPAVDPPTGGGGGGGGRANRSFGIL